MSGWRVFARARGFACPTLSSDELGGSRYPEIGRTTNFTVFAQAVLGRQGVEIANSLLANCERDYSIMRGFFGVVPSRLPFKVYVTKDISGAMHYGCDDTEIYVGAIDSVPPSHSGHNLLLLAEVVEVFEANIGRGWSCGFSNGEGLSRVLANEVYSGPDREHDLLTNSVTSSAWLDEAPPRGSQRQNWVDHNDPEDTNKFSIGCAVLFLNWLRSVLGFSWSQIAATGASARSPITLANTYTSLTGRSDAWLRFKAEIDARFDPSIPSGLQTDNPFR